MPNSPMSDKALVPIWPLGTAAQQRGPMRFAAAAAHAAVEPVLIHARLDGRHIDDLVAKGLAGANHRRAALALSWRRALVNRIDFGFGQQGSERAGVTLLRTALALAGSALGAIGPARVHPRTAAWRSCASRA